MRYIWTGKNIQTWLYYIGGSRGLMDRALDLKPEVVGSNLGSGTTEVRPLSKAPNPQLLPGHRSVSCPLLQVCVHLDGLNAENTFHSSLYSVCDK